LEFTERALARGARGPYALQAAIAALHAEAKRPQDTDWHQIVALYELLLQQQTSPVIELNRAAAVAMADGPQDGLRLLEALAERGELKGYYLLPAARGDMLRRLSRWAEAEEAYRDARLLVVNDAERRFLDRRLAEMQQRSGRRAPTG